MTKSDVSSAVADSGIGRTTHGFRWQACDVEAAWRAAVDAGVRTSSAYTSWRQPRHAPSAHTIMRYYGSWPAALQAAGHASGPVDPSRVVIRRALQTLWQRDGRPPTATAWRTWTERPVALTTVVHHYDSWRAALAAAARPDLPLPPLSWSPGAQRFLALDVATLSGEEHAIRVALLTHGSIRGAARALFWSPSGLQARMRRACRHTSPAASAFTQADIRHTLQRALRHQGPAVLAVHGWQAAGLHPSVNTIIRVYGQWSRAWAAAAPHLPRRRRGHQRREPGPAA